MLNKSLLQLQQGFSHILNDWGLSQTGTANIQWGVPEQVERAANRVRTIFEEYASAPPPKERAYQAALKFLTNKKLDEEERDFIAAAITIPIKECGGKRVIDSARFPLLLTFYKKEIQADRLWRLAWFWLLQSYFTIPQPEEEQVQAQKNKTGLQQFLLQTQLYFTKEEKFSPEWVKALQIHHRILSDDPCSVYVTDVLRENYRAVDEIKQHIGIPQNSWFWHQLSFSVVNYIVSLKSDRDFKEKINIIIQYIHKHNGYRDQALKLTLERYYRCQDRSPHRGLRDYVVRSDVWRNPKLRNLGQASKWYALNEKAWLMVLNWVTKEHLRLFFDIISGRNGAQKDRFHFWLQYLEQITFTKLAFGEETQFLKRGSPEIKKLFEEEKDVYATLKASDKSLDAFIIQIKDYIFVEFSMNGNAAFIYHKDKLPFLLNARRMNDRTAGDGLKAAQKNKIIHSGDWQLKTRDRLMDLGIFPDKNSSLTPRTGRRV